MKESDTNVIAIIRNGFFHAGAKELLPGIQLLNYNIGDSFQHVWENAVKIDPKFVLLADSAIPLSKNLYWLMYQLLDSNPTVDGITFDTEGLVSVYGLLPSQNGQRAQYSSRKILLMPSLAYLVRPEVGRNQRCKLLNFSF